MAAYKKGMRKTDTPKTEVKETAGKCGECANCTPVTKFRTLSIKGEPTMGRCPKEKHCVLLSQEGCREWQKRTAPHYGPEKT